MVASENRLLCVPDDIPVQQRFKYLLARSFIVRHLQQHQDVTGVQLHVFPSILSEEFTNYVHMTPIHFFMYHDGASPTTTSGKQEVHPMSADMHLTTDGVSGHPSVISSKDAKELLRANIWAIQTCLRLNVALVNRAEFRDSKVFTMVLEGTHDSMSTKAPTNTDGDRSAEPNHHRLSQQSWRQLKDYLIQTETESGDQVNTDVSSLLVKLEDSLGSYPEGVLLNIAAVSMIISRQADCNQAIVVAFLIHSLLLTVIPINQRRLPLTRLDQKTEQDLQSFLAQYALVAMDILDNSVWEESMTAHDIISNLADSVDGRLLKIILQSVMTGTFNQELPTLEAKLGEMLDVVKSISGQGLSLLSAKSNLVLVAPVTSSDQSESTASIVNRNMTVLPFSNPVFDSHLDCIQLETETPLVSRPMGKTYRETTHWHNMKSLLPTIARKEDAPVSKWKSPLRLNQRYMAEMTAYAASLTGTKGKALEPETVTVGSKPTASVPQEKVVKPTKQDSGQKSKPPFV